MRGDMLKDVKTYWKSLGIVEGLRKKQTHRPQQLRPPCRRRLHVSQCAVAPSPCDAEVAYWGSRSALTTTFTNHRAFPKGHQSSFTARPRRQETFTPAAPSVHMSSPLLDVWEAAASSPFSPTVGKNTQFTLGFLLLSICMFAALLREWSHVNQCPALILTTIFGLSMRNTPSLESNAPLTLFRPVTRQPASPWVPGFIGIRVRGLGSWL